MLFLYVATKYEYGNPKLGLSFEHFNFYETLCRLGHDVLYFDHQTLLKKYGLSRMSRRLAEVVRTDRPVMTFCVLTGDQASRRVMRDISDSGLTRTVNWYCDDHFNFESFSRRWTPSFNWVVTTSELAMGKYEGAGLTNAIKSQWGCNHFRYQKVETELKYEATFVGANHGNRGAFVGALREAGIEVRCRGKGWDGGRIEQDEMIKLFSQSRINLNFTNGAAAPTRLRAIRDRLSPTILGRLDRSVGKVLRAARGGTGKKGGEESGESRDGGAVELERLLPSGIAQIKGRTFEVPGCGGFLMTGGAENVGDYYRDGKEAAIFGNGRELVDRVKYFLANEGERAAVAEAGYRRTLAEHTYVHRFRDIFARVGIGNIDFDSALARKFAASPMKEVD
jgi:spore maturation protein CgeB